MPFSKLAEHPLGRFELGFGLKGANNDPCAECRNDYEQTDNASDDPAVDRPPVRARHPHRPVIAEHAVIESQDAVRIWALFRY